MTNHLAACLTNWTHGHKSLKQALTKHQTEFRNTKSHTEQMAKGCPGMLSIYPTILAPGGFSDHQRFSIKHFID